ncbi:YitT family protein [Vibrio superstes]|uniref:Membrane protein n=1 Tax=Vibrio superstes NBRC 103154 TaxID=1219062 RepID=A0A511QS99_9VIBR|nr:YitT family protein [Vibrio superstes]GEM80229.1 membrane protein [Vibrio superstes NBRC 103154]
MNKHSFLEDCAAIFTGTLLVAVGIYFLKSSSMIVGGTAGLGLLFTQFIDLSFGTMYFLVNIPFYFLAWFRLGKRFTINSVICVSLVSVMADNLHHVMRFELLTPAFAAIAGGTFIGLGLLVLFRHRASLGGSNVLCLVIQDKMGISVGKTQLLFDTSILICSLYFIPLTLIAWSILAAVFINLILWMNHKPTRYTVHYER